MKNKIKRIYSLPKKNGGKKAIKNCIKRIKLMILKKGDKTKNLDKYKELYKKDPIGASKYLMW